MNKVILIIITLVFTFSVNAIENKFDGSWELISGEYQNNKGAIIQYEDLKIDSIKVISGTHFSFVSMSGDKFWSSGAGSYRFTEKKYIESPIYTSYGATLGKEYVLPIPLKITFGITLAGMKASVWSMKFGVNYQKCSLV